MKQTELAWAAGFFDGEGSVFCYDHNTRGYLYPTVAIRIGQSGSKEVLVRFNKAVKNLGRIHGPYAHSQPGRKKVYALQVNRYDDILQIAECLWPYLSSVKKKQFNKAFRRHNREY